MCFCLVGCGCGMGGCYVEWSGCCGGECEFDEVNVFVFFVCNLIYLNYFFGWILNGINNNGW